MIVKQLYEDNRKLSNVPLLGTNTFDWWQEYITNHAQYDRFFCRLYSSFNYDMDDLSDFKYDVQAILLINRKKYEELHRIYTVSDDVFGIATNYDMLETMNRTGTSSTSATSGERTDTNISGSRTDTNTAGERTDTNTAGERTDTNTAGERTDTNTAGARTDSNVVTGTESNSATNNTQNATIQGQRTDVNNLKVGEQNLAVVNNVTAFNSAAENTDNSGITANGSRNDITQFTQGQQTDTSRTETTESNTLSKNDTTNYTKGAETDSFKKGEEITTFEKGEEITTFEKGEEITTFEKGSETDSFKKGSETDTSTGQTAEQYTLTRKGNIGVKDSADILSNAANVMMSGIFEFYKIVFADICKELLLL